MNEGFNLPWKVKFPFPAVTPSQGNDGNFGLRRSVRGIHRRVGNIQQWGGGARLCTTHGTDRGERQQGMKHPIAQGRNTRASLLENRVKEQLSRR